MYDIPKYNEDGTLKHVFKPGARYHVLSWDGQGVHCSEPNCEVNRQQAMAER